MVGRKEGRKIKKMEGRRKNKKGTMEELSERRMERRKTMKENGWKRKCWKEGVK